MNSNIPDNYIRIYIFDRGVVVSVLPLIMSNDDGLGLSPSEAGSLGSVFIVGFMLAAPIYAYLA